MTPGRSKRGEIRDGRAGRHPGGNIISLAPLRQAKSTPITWLRFKTTKTNYTDLLKFLDASVSFYLGHGSIAGASYGSDEAGAQATAQSERTKPVLVANRFHAISQASMMSARLRNTELASQWLRR
jgi:hypothetical protein